jgi:hypothetical protein
MTAQGRLRKFGIEPSQRDRRLSTSVTMRPQFRSFEEMPRRSVCMPTREGCDATMSYRADSREVLTHRAPALRHVVIPGLEDCSGSTAYY